LITGFSQAVKQVFMAQIFARIFGELH